MSNSIHIQKVSPKYQINQCTGLICCKLTLIFCIFADHKVFHSEGYAHCTKENIFNEAFGKAIAYRRAIQDIDRQIEISLVKYSFDHFVKEEIRENEFNRKVINLIDRLKERSECY